MEHADELKWMEQAKARASAGALRVLTLGDGNFSFSYGLLKRFHSSQVSTSSSSSGQNDHRRVLPNGIVLTATSYDSREELCAKYPETSRLLTQLEDLGARVLHRVDATQLEQVFRPASSSTSAPLGSGVDQGDAFDWIIFNHPHVGEENVARHQQLLSHFFHSAKQLLANGPTSNQAMTTNPTSADHDTVSGESAQVAASTTTTTTSAFLGRHQSGSTAMIDETSSLSTTATTTSTTASVREPSQIHVTLASTQPKAWQIEQRAAWEGLVLKEKCNVHKHPVHGSVEYEWKRHQSGKSFQNVLLHGEKRHQQSQLFIFTLPHPTSVTTTADSTTSHYQESSDGSATGEPVAKKQKPSQALPFPCGQCDKSFATRQGVKTHTHMVHELAKNESSSSNGTASDSSKKRRMVCTLCKDSTRTFSNQEALKQHSLAKHGRDPLIQPDWYKQAKDPMATSGGLTPSQSKGRPQSEMVQCPICRHHFEDQQQFDAHMKGLAPIEMKQVHCSKCSRAFRDQRALRQHQNFCLQTSTPASAPPAAFAEDSAPAEPLGNDDASETNGTS